MSSAPSSAENCIICFDRPPIVKFYPCEHLLVCGECLSEYSNTVSTYNRCSICRAEILEYKSIVDGFTLQLDHTWKQQNEEDASEAEEDDEEAIEHDPETLQTLEEVLENEDSDTLLTLAEIHLFEQEGEEDYEPSDSDTSEDFSDDSEAVNVDQLNEDMDLISADSEDT